MTAWTTITNALVAVGAKPFATTVQALRDNPIAIAEGAAGAPRVQGIALGGIYVSGGSAVNNAFVAFTGLSNTGFVEISASINCTNTAVIRVSFSADNGASWGANQTIYTATTGSNVHKLTFIVSLQTGVSALDGVNVGAATNFGNFATLSVPTNCNAVRIGSTGGTTIAQLKRLGGLE